MKQNSSSRRINEQARQVIAEIIMFEVADLVLVSKMDVAQYFDFSLEKLTENVRLRNPHAQILPLSAKTGEGMDAWIDWLRAEVAAWKA